MTPETLDIFYSINNIIINNYISQTPLQIMIPYFILFTFIQRS